MIKKKIGLIELLLELRNNRVTCYVSGNMMTSVLRREEGDAYSLQQFICSNKKETPPENKDLEVDFKTFLEKGICKISRTGKIVHRIFKSTYKI